MPLFIAQDYEPLPAGLYVGKLLDIDTKYACIMAHYAKDYKA
jgi:hypothetical protein